MRLVMDTEKNKVSSSIEVVSIEATEPYAVAHDDEEYEDFHRTIRFNLGDGEAIELHCTSSNAKAIELKQVKKLKALHKRKRNWLLPQVYKGNVEDAE